MSRLCSMCKENLAKGQGYCKPCAVIYSRKWRVNNRERARELSRQSTIKNKFKITANEFDEMKKAAGSICPICLEEKEKLVLDHRHEPFKVRQFICDGCNGFVGHLEKKGKLEAALAYIEKHAA